MKRSSRPPRTPFNLCESVRRQLNLYAIAASAAGVGVLAPVQPAEGKIVYTPAHKKIEQNRPPLPFDLNHDGIPDFYFTNHYDVVSFLDIAEANSANEIWDAKSKGRLCAGALPEGFEVGPSVHFRKDPILGLDMAYTSAQTYFGPWHNVKHAYLGLKFTIKGKTHFGWARLKVTTPGWYNGITAVLTGYAYETIANKPIITGKTGGPDEIGSVVPTDPPTLGASTREPVTLGLLAQGAAGLVAWRKRDAGQYF
jgi:hypothetical protein